MTTVIGFTCVDGAVIAADRTIVRDGRIQSRNRQRVYDFDDWGLAIASDEATGIRDRVEVEVREYETREGGTPSIDTLGRLAGDVASDTNGSFIVVGRDDQGEASVLAIHDDGSRIEDSPLALGDGVDLALGALEGADTTDLSTSEAADLARDTIKNVAERDTATGDEVDVWTLENA